VNRVILIGRLTADPELRFTSSGLAVANIRLVTNDREVPEYHDVVIWRQLAETAGKYLVKGRLVYVEGHLRGRTWTAKDGATRRSVEIVGENVQFLSSRAAGAEEGCIPLTPRRQRFHQLPRRGPVLRSTRSVRRRKRAKRSARIPLRDNEFPGTSRIEGSPGPLRG
jgi:single-strand DNA-binding protein